MKKFLPSKIVIGVFVLLCVLGGAGYWWLHVKDTSVEVAYKTPHEADVYVRFDMEAYDKLQQNFWMKTEDKDLAQLFQLALQKATNATSAPALLSPDRSGVAGMLATAFAAATSTQAKVDLARNVLIVALYNLPPNGRSGLLSDKQEKELRQNVANVNPAKDLYQDLGLAKGASVEQVAAAAASKEAILKNSTAPESKEELKKVSYAKEVLTASQSKALYDEQRIEPTAFSRILGKTLYFNLTKISPTTLQEFAVAVEAASTTPGLDSMILDLRGNVGGSLDFTQYFLGLFIGKDQYAFDLFHQGEYTVQRTALPQFDRLDRYKDIALLTDGNTQSTAELTTVAFKRFKLGHVVGTKTRGWGTVENTYPLETVIDEEAKYSLLLVNNITLRGDNQPVEGRGVEPDVDTSKAGWQNDLSKYFTSPSLIQALRTVAAKAPLQ